MMKDNFTPTWHYVWFDKCARQFKFACPFYFLCLYPKIIGRQCQMLCFFFGTSHGKGEHDKVGVVMKWALQTQ
jgi:hypothetical protein